MRQVRVAEAMVAGTLLVGAAAAAAGEAAGSDIANPFRGCSATPVFAHRGDTKLYTENTRAAVDSALRVSGAVEVDVRTAADDTLVLMHDRNVRRTTNGTGLVATKTWRQLRAYRTPDGFRIPRLARILRMVRDRPSSLVMLDLKALTGRSAREMTRLIDVNRISSRVSIISFDYAWLDMVKGIDGSLDTSIIATGSRAPTSVEEGHGAQVFPRLMTDDWVAAMNDAGVHFTSRIDDTRAGWARGIEVGTHAVVSDKPRAFLRACRRGRLPDVTG
jgi:glycerophosphoryl diester phosphodiesterase